MLNGRIRNLNDLIMLAQQLIKYLKSKDVKFKDSFPVFDNNWFLKDIPEMIVPVDQRHNRIVVNKKKTCLCFFCSDYLIYRRLIKILDEISIYKEYMGVVSFDITITADMDSEWQNFLFLVNCLLTATLGVNGIKIVPSTRIGSYNMVSLLKVYPRNIVWASGLLGCSKENKNDFSSDYIDKILNILPSKLLLYGKVDKILNERLDIIGIDYIYFKDFHSLSKKVYCNGR